jgi:glycosyltransferase involved in cell wall biosynthesis
VKIAYLSNRFPSTVEPYFEAEMLEFKKRGIDVLACSILRPVGDQIQPARRDDVVYTQPPRLLTSLLTLWALISRFPKLRPFLHRALVGGDEPFMKRLRTLFHTCMGAYLATLLRKRRVQHIHVHHGYFAAWVAMVAARLLGISYSLTLHGSDLLVRGDYLDMKLAECKFCVTISEFNQRFIFEHYPQIPAAKILVQRMGVECATRRPPLEDRSKNASCFRVLAVGRLHPVKDHAFLIQACWSLADQGIDFLCRIAGDGPEKDRLTERIRELSLTAQVELLGELCRAELPSAYSWADLVVLTSKSEGIPLTLMEAMEMGKPVLAPNITGIPELVINGKTGFLYHAGSMEHFIAQLLMVRDLRAALGPICDAARRQVFENFNQETNLAAFCEIFLSQLDHIEGNHREGPLLQQIQLSI